MGTPSDEREPLALGILGGLHRSVREGGIPVWRALALGGTLLGLGLALAGLLGAGCYLAALLVVAFVRGGPDQGVSPDDPVVLSVALSMGLAILLLVAIGTPWHRRRLARHRAGMRAWSEANGWSYAPRSSALSSRWRARSRPASGHATDVLRRTGPRGEVASMTMGPRWGVDRWTRHAVMVAGPRRFPALSVTPMAGWDRVLRALGGQDIAVESHGINERWRVRCADARFAHEVLSPRLLERLDGAGVPGLRFLVEERDVVVHAPGPTALDQVGTLADLAFDLAALLPAYLPDDYPPFAPDVPRRHRRQAPSRAR
ncbi:hypothetical protein [Actinotalea sp. C106]|uniref:hypothetical protein n=1 Tax=Actinotalea sp. C106 TaxID=2908644 RepID=UPI002027B9B7|nr:hypothetical protein [Actinotalea sp. C106]